MVATRPLTVWSLLLGLSLLIPAQSKEEESLGNATVRPTPEDRGDQSPNPDFCDFTFHIPWSGSSCTQTTQATTTPASQEELDHLKILLEDLGGNLKSLQEAAALEAGQSRYQDIVSQALPDVREANGEFHEILGKFLQELEEHIHADDHLHAEDEKKKLNEHLRGMDRMLRVTSHLADQLDQASQDLLVKMTSLSEKPAIRVEGSALKTS
ncbi:uncharacterized protein LOC114594948 [Podarcis muralis]